MDIKRVLVIFHKIHIPSENGVVSDDEDTTGTELIGRCFVPSLSQFIN
jgi:glutaredoxin 2